MIHVSKNYTLTRDWTRVVRTEVDYSLICATEAISPLCLKIITTEQRSINVFLTYLSRHHAGLGRIWYALNLKFKQVLTLKSNKRSLNLNVTDFLYLNFFHIYSDQLIDFGKF